ncbi:hypothetical protein SEA_ZOOBEAR_42 [Streptomyces phage ZooBear]|uniref:Uncharacterized protein n=2 Tax=Immanueltrevirus immanuel3 TaxID=2846399 RepID=A0A2H5BM05_9CAUD|nr:hypothetical protein SEA_HAUGEANATOR_42 [Streptomyces phage HaugeAnator]AUG87603.1 hypothetical protein SEA_ZOOBEAR_42 [Streptomyces phage ZooBear]
MQVHLMAGKFKKGARCSSACLTKDHRTFGECMRSKSLNLNPNLSNTQATKAWDGELQAYRDARAQGIQPAGTTRAKVQEAVEISNHRGKAFNADAPFS